MAEARSSLFCRWRRAGTALMEGMGYLLWPPSCGVCARPDIDLNQGLCRRCWQDLSMDTAGDYCPRCGLDASPYALIDGACPSCLGKAFSFDHVIRCGFYTGILRDMIVAFKHDRTEFDRVLGGIARSAAQGSDVLQEVDWIVPVPLHWTRRLIRGYNQATLIAKGARPGMGCSARVVHALTRTRRTRMQPTVVSPAARHKNVAGAFKVRRGCGLAGKQICLVDDVKTTGATLDECAKVLKDAGARRVYALVLAVAARAT